MKDQAGKVIEVSKNYCDDKQNFEVRAIPANHVIVGVYGKIFNDGANKRIPNLGFIVMKTQPIRDIFSLDWNSSASLIPASLY